MSTYDITVCQFGFATIEADTEDQAWEIARAMGHDDFDWSWDFEVTDCQEGESYGKRS